MKELREITKRLHAPKNMTNNFGKFQYRNAEGILEAVKPLLDEYKCVLTCETDVKMIGDRYYIEANVELVNESGESANAKAQAREQDSKSGMDAAQLTGGCISYAKKYALCNLFCIDDSTDDPDNPREEEKKQSVQQVKKVQQAAQQAQQAVSKEDVVKVTANIMTISNMNDVKKYIAEHKINLNLPEYQELRVKLNNKFAPKA